MGMAAPSITDRAVSSIGQDIKVMIVDDSAVVRGLVSKWVGEESGMKIVARHVNGQKAVEDVANSAPDIIILDIEMPVMDGLTALPKLLKSKPGVKIVMASTLTQRNAEISLNALSLGATDYIPKPDSNSGITTSASFKRDLLARIRSLGRARSLPVARRTPAPQTPRRSTAPTISAAKTAPVKTDPNSALKPFSTISPRILLVGSSTGGPQALIKVFESIAPKIGNIPVLVTQHMPATFTTILAKHIADASHRPCREALTGEELKPGQIYVAPGGFHMRLQSASGGAQIVLDQGPEINFCRPAVDPLFESAAKIYRSGVLAVILTGMGQDGAQGAKIISQSGGSVIVQDEETSVVWGMPGAAVAAGVCSAVLPLPQIGPKINSLLK